MNHYKLLRGMIGVTLVALFVVGCSASAATPTPIVVTATPKPTPTPPAMAIVTSQGGVVTEVRASSLKFSWKEEVTLFQYTNEYAWGLPLASGVIVPFKKMKSFEIVRDGSMKAAITLLDDQTVTEGLAHPKGDLEGTVELGSFSLSIRDVKRVDFE